MLNRFNLDFYSHLNTDKHTYIEHIKYGKLKLNFVGLTIYFLFGELSF